MNRKKSEESCRIVATYRAAVKHSPEDLAALLPTMVNSLCSTGRFVLCCIGFGAFLSCPLSSIPLEEQSNRDKSLLARMLACSA